MNISHIASKRIVQTSLVLGFVVVVGFAERSNSNVAWKRFSLHDQGLTVSMPGEPKSKKLHSASFIGDIVTHEYYLDEGLDSYTVDFTDLPGFAVAFSGREIIYEHAKGALLLDTLSKPISFTDVTLNGVTGKKLVYDTPTKPGHPEMQGEARFFLAGDRLYTADAVVEMQGGDEKLARFFASLEIKP
jgi:hypothetical protein